EAYVDSVQGFEASGIINSSEQFPTLTKAIIQELNEKEGEKNISLGYHVIEFLLWGQDTDPMGPGRRSYTDYVDSDSNPAPARRGTYLKIATELLLKALQQVAGGWADNGDNYRKKLLSMPADQALSRILIGIGILSGPELSGERLTVAYVTKEQEEEHSCFSDTTHLDMINNARGIRNIYMGTYRRINGEVVSGKGIHHLLMEMDSEFADEMNGWVQASLDLARKIPPPFDQAILGKRTAPGRIAIKALINALIKQSTGTARAAKILNLPIHEQQFDSPI
ncbi:MAG TPA: iron-regulated protein, partial [Verrucomicrobiales bacterium]|nr:iron-regulated protein [Verrucomicrobiales bacterium]